jgi:O-antigen/teichoic acid export membrane protein
VIKMTEVLTLDKDQIEIVLIVLAIVALVAAVAWLSHRRRQRSRTRWITDKYKQMARLLDFGLSV